MASRSKGWRWATRRGRRILIIDFLFTNTNGRPERYRKDAPVQMVTATASEARRLMAFAAEHGFVEFGSGTSSGSSATPVVASSKSTFKEFAEGMFESDFMPSYKPSTRRRYRDLLRQHVMAEVGGRRLDEIGANEYRAFAVKLKKAKVQSKGPLNLLRTVLRAAVSAEVLLAMPPLPGGLTRDSKKLPQAPGYEEVATQIAACPPWLQVAIGLAAYAGLRSGEIRALQVRHLDLKARRIHVELALSDDEVTTTKSGDERWAPIPEQLVPLLESARRLKLPTARLVVTPPGNTPTRQNLLNALRAAQRKHGLKGWTVHAFRHAFCSELVRRGVGVETVRVMAGHADLKTTARYLHAAQEDLVSATRALSEVGNSVVTGSDPVR